MCSQHCCGNRAPCKPSGIADWSGRALTQQRNPTVPDRIETNVLQVRPNAPTTPSLQHKMSAARPTAQTVSTKVHRACAQQVQLGHTVLTAQEENGRHCTATKGGRCRAQAKNINNDTTSRAIVGPSMKRKGSSLVQSSKESRHHHWLHLPPCCSKQGAHECSVASAKAPKDHGSHLTCSITIHTAVGPQPHPYNSAATKIKQKIGCAYMSWQQLFASCCRQPRPYTQM